MLAHPSKQQRPKFGQSPSGWPGDQQVDTFRVDGDDDGDGGGDGDDGGDGEDGGW